MLECAGNPGESQVASNFEYELRVQHFLVENGVTFIAPQFGLAYSKELESGGSNPDFVAIRPGKKECFVVEVSVSGGPGSLAEKIKIREKQWYRVLRDRLTRAGVINDSWSMEVLAFVRADQLEWFVNRVGSGNDVHVWPIEYVLQHWLWPSEVRGPEFDFRKTELAHSNTSLQGRRP